MKFNIFRPRDPLLGHTYCIHCFSHSRLPCALSILYIKYYNCIYETAKSGSENEGGNSLTIIGKSQTLIAWKLRGTEFELDQVWEEDIFEIIN